MRSKAMVSALPLAIRQETEKEIYKIYITDALKAISENTMNACGGGTYMRTRFYDVINPTTEDTRTVEEMVDDVISAAGIEVI